MRLLETIREFAGEQLDANGERHDALLRHAAFFEALAELAARRLTGPDQGLWMDRLEADHDNLRAAIRWALDQRQDALALRLTGSLSWFWTVRGYFTEGRAWYARVLQHAEGQPARLCIRPLSGAATLALQLGEYDDARDLYEQALTLQRELGSERGVATLLNGLATVAQRRGDYATGRQLEEEALAIQEAAGNIAGMASSLNNLGIMADYQGDWPAARAYYTRALELRRQLGDTSGILNTLSNLGSVASLAGDRVEARALLTESLALARKIGERRQIGRNLHNLGNLAALAADYDTALGLYEEARTIYSELGDAWNLAAITIALAGAAYQAGDNAEARALAEQGIERWRRIGNPVGIAPALVLLGRILARGGDRPAARSVLEESIELARSLDSGTAIASSYQALGEVLWAEGDVRAASACWQQSLDIVDDAGDRTAAIPTLESISVAVLSAGEGRRAARLCAAAASMRTATSFAVQPVRRAVYDAHIEAMRGQFGPEAFAAEWATGGELTLEEAIAEARSCLVVIETTSVEPSALHIRTHGHDRPAAVRHAAPETLPAGLTPREAEILGLIATGRSNKEIARVLVITIPTVERHIIHLYTKIGARGRADATAFALTNGLLPNA